MDSSHKDDHTPYHLYRSQMIFGSILSSLGSLFFFFFVQLHFIYTSYLYTEWDKTAYVNKWLAVYLDFPMAQATFTLICYNLVFGVLFFILCITAYPADLGSRVLFQVTCNFSILTETFCKVRSYCCCSLIRWLRDVTTVWLLFDNISINISR